MTALRLVQGTPEWIEGRRHLVTGTDIPVLLGLSPYRCEADLADEKQGGAGVDENLRMRVGKALEPTILAEWERVTGLRAVRFRAMVAHPVLTWAAASPDARVIGRRALLELKWTGSRTRFADGLPQDVEAQAAWQLGVTGYPEGEVVVLTPDDLLRFPVTHDPDLFADLVRVAEDFRRRLAEGGPFARDDDRIRRDHPSDNGVMLPATPDLVALADELRAARVAKADADAREKTVASALRAVLLDASGIQGVLTYRKSADATRTNWPAVALAYRARLEPVLTGAELDAVIEDNSETKTGPRVLRLSKESNE